MSETIANEIIAAFTAERQRRGPSAVRAAAVVSVCGYIGFAVVDPFVASAPLRLMLMVRCLTIVSIACIYLAARSHRAHTYGDFLGSILFGVVSSGIIVLTVFAGGGMSRYHDPLALTFVGYAVFVPTSLWVAMPMIVSAIVTYDGLLIALRLTGPAPTFLTNNAVLLLAGFTAGALVMVTNRSRMREFKLKYELSVAHEGLKALDLAKSNFFANVSHELRTPLTLILATVECMQEEIPSNQTHEQHQLDLCRRNSLRLLCLVDDLLELSRLESASLRLRINQIDLGKVAQDLAEQVRPLAQRKSITLVCEPGTHNTVIADDTQIERIILNLLANAVKFTPAGGTIRLAVSTANNSVAVRVEDTGEGIPAVALPYVFDRFYQATRSRTSEQRGGVGIGLSLCKKIVELHKGTIVAESKLGQGTSITFTIPKEAVFDNEAVERRSEQVPAGKERRNYIGLSEWDRTLRDKTEYKFWRVEEATERRIVPRASVNRAQGAGILVVDDNRDIVELLTGILHGEFVVYTALDGERGLQAARTHKPDLIISDLMMPQLSGFDLLRAIREDATLRDTPFILLTARGQVEDRINALEMDADAYIAKPFHPVELRTTVRKLLQKVRSQSEAMLDHRALALRVMAEGIAHDILNPLGFVRGAVLILSQLVKEAVSLAPTANPRVAEIAAEAEQFFQSGDEGMSRVQAAIAELRSFSRGDTSEPSPADVNDAVSRVIAVAGVRSQVTPELSPTYLVALRPGQLEQVLLNLIINAQQAAGPKAEVKIQTHNDETLHGVVIAVQDNGPGIDRQTLKRIFDPYFTTKEMGTGLGLSVSRQIVRDHGGAMTVESTPNVGTTFKLWFPRVP